MALKDSWVTKNFTPADDLAAEREAALLEEMGLEDRDIKKLQQQMLSPDEAVCAKAEELSHIRTTRGRKPEWQEFLDVKARMGRVLPGGEIIYRLRKLLPQLRCHDGTIKGTISLFTPVVRTFEDGFHPGWEYVGWIYRDWNPEYQIDYCDEDGVPIGKRQGWRTLLLNNIIKMDGDGKIVLKERGLVQNGTGLPLRILTEQAADKIFGPACGYSASLYRRALWNFRNGRNEKAAWAF